MQMHKKAEKVERNKYKFFYCRTCKKRVGPYYGTSTPVLIEHIVVHHPEVKLKYDSIPIKDMLRACYSIKMIDEEEDNQ